MVAVASTPASSNALINECVQGLELTAYLGNVAIDLINSIEFEALALDALSDTLVAMNATVQIGISSPLGNATLEATELLSNLTLLDANNNVLGSVVPSAIILDSSATHIHAQLSGLLNVASVVFMGDLIHSFVNSPFVGMRIVGTARVSANTSAIGEIVLNGIVIDQNVTLAGLDGIPDVTVTAFSLLGSTATQIVPVLSVSFPNPTVVTMNMGQLFMDVFFSGTQIGSVSAASAQLSQGTSTFDLSGVISIAPGNLGLASQLFSNYLTGVSTPIQAKASNPASSITIVNAGLQGVVLSTDLPGTTAPLVTGIAFTDLSLTPLSDTTVAMTASIVASIDSPLGSLAPLTINSLDLGQVTLANGELVVFGTLDASNTVVGASNNSQAQATVSGTMTVSDAATFIGIMQAFVQTQAGSQIALDSPASNIVATLSIGQVSLTSVAVNPPPSSLPGLGGLTDNSVTAFSLASSTASEIVAVTTLQLNNPSFVSVALGATAFDIYYNGAFMGHFVSAADTALVPGSNLITLSGTITPAASDLPTASGLFGAYVNQQPSGVQAVAPADANGNQLINGGLQGLIINTTLPGAPNPLISGLTYQALSLTPLSNSAIDLSADVTVLVDSPLGSAAPMTVNGLSLGSVVLTNSNGDSIGSLTPSLSVLSSNNAQIVTSMGGVVVASTQAQQDAFSALMAQMVSLPSTTVGLTATATAQVTLSIGNITLANVLVNVPSSELTGLNNLPGVQVTSFSLGASNATTIVANVDVQFVNPSVVSMQLGALNFDVFFDGVKVGRMTAQDANLVSGTTALSLVGTISPASADLATAGVLFSQYLSNIGSAIQAMAPADGSVSANSLISKGLAPMALNTTLPGSTAALATGITFTDLQLNPINSTVVSVSGSFQVTIASPLGNSPLSFSAMSMNANLINGNSGVTMGTLSNAAVVISSSNYTQITGTLTNVLMTISGTSGAAAFSSLINSFINQPSVLLQITSTATMSSTMVIGTVPLTNVPVAPPATSLTGLNGISNVVVTSFSLASSTATSINAFVTVQFPTAGYVTFTTGAVNFNILYDGVNMGLFTSDSSSVVTPGTTTLNLTGTITPANLTVAGQMFSSYINGQLTPVAASASANASTNSLISNGLAGLTLNTNLPGSTVPLVSGVSFSALNLNPTSATQVAMTATIVVGITSPLGSLAPLTTNTLNLGTVSLLNGASVAMGTITPVTVVQSSSNTVVTATLSGTINVSSQSAFSSMIQEFVNQATTSLFVSSVSTVVVTMSIGQVTLTNININPPASTLPGLSGLPNVNVVSFSMLTSNATSLNAALTISFNNPSNVTFDMGATNFDVYYGGAKMGRVTTASTSVIVPGTTTLSLTGVIAPAQSNLAIASALFSAYVSQLSSFVQAIIPSDASSNPLINGGLQGLVLNTTLPGAPNPLISGLTYQQMTLDPVSATSVPMTAGITVLLNSPLGSAAPMSVNGLTLTNVALTNSAGNSIGGLVSTITVLSSSNTQIVTSLTGTISPGTAAQQSAFSALMSSMVTQASTTIGLTALATAQVTLSIGNLTLTNVTANVPSSTLTGLNNLPGVTVTSFSLGASNATGIYAAVTVQFNNPSVVTMELGTLNFDIFFQGVQMGRMTAANANLVTGTTTMSLVGTIAPASTSLATAGVLFSQYLTNVGSAIQAKAPSDGSVSANSLISNGLAAMAMNTTLPGSPAALATGITFTALTLNPTSSTAVTVSGSFQVSIASPLGSSPLSFSGMTMVSANLINGATGVTMGTLTNAAVSVTSSSNSQITGSLSNVVLTISGTTGATAFSSLISQYVNNASVLLQITSTASMTASMVIGAVPLSNIPVSPAATSLTGLNGISNVVVTAFSLASSTATQILGQVTVQFPVGGVVTFDMGSVNFTIKYNGVSMGTFTSASTTVLSPGTSTMSLSGQILPVGDPGLIQTTALFQSYVSGLTTLASVVVPANACSNTLIANGLVGLTISTSLPGMTSSIVSGATYQSLNLQPNYVQTNLVGFTAGVTIFLNSPLGPNGKLLTNSITLNAEAIDGGSGNVMGQYTVTSPVVPTSSSNTQIVALLPGTITLLGTGTAFTTYMVEFVNQVPNTLSLQLVGSTVVNVTTSIGTLALNVTNLVVNSTVYGIGGLPTIEITSVSLPQNLPGPGGVQLNVNASLANPSIATLNLGNLTFGMYYQGAYQGYANVPAFTFYPGGNTLSAAGAILPDPNFYNVTGNFFTNYLAGLTNDLNVTLTLSVTAPTGGTVPAWLASACAQLKPAGQVIAPQGLQLINNVTLSGPLSVNLAPATPTLSGTVQLTFTNPFTFGLNVRPIQLPLIVIFKNLFQFVFRSWRSTRCSSTSTLARRMRPPPWLAT